MKIINSLFDIKTKDSTNRIYYLDFIRGILILLVLYQHAGVPLSSLVLQFHMPALFVLSGYTESILDKQKTFGMYIKAKFFRLIIPYFCFEFLSLAIFTFMCLGDGIDFSIVAAIISIFTCLNSPFSGLYGRLWFLPAMFLVSNLSYLIKRITKNQTFLTAVFCIAMFAASYASTLLPFRLPFTIDIAFLGTGFFLLGYLCRNAIKYILESEKHPIIMCSFAGFAAAFIIGNAFAKPCCYMYINHYENFPVMLLCAVSGTVITFIISKYLFVLFNKIHILTNIVFWYSINSLAVFPVHLTIKMLFLPLLDLVGLNHWACLFIIMFVLTIPIVNIITNYFPCFLGIYKMPLKEPLFKTTE